MRFSQELFFYGQIVSVFFYFAVQTRRQEITRQEYEKLSEDEKSLYTRQNVKDKNKYLFVNSKYYFQKMFWIKKR